MIKFKLEGKRIQRGRTESLDTLLNALVALRAVLLVDPRQDISHAQNLPGVDGNVRSLARRATGWFCPYSVGKEEST